MPVRTHQQPSSSVKLPLPFSVYKLSLQTPPISGVPRPCDFSLLLCRDSCPSITFFCTKTPFHKARPPGPSPSRGGDAHSYSFLPTASHQRSSSGPAAGAALGARRPPGAPGRLGPCGSAPCGASRPAEPRAPPGGNRPARSQIPAKTLGHSRLHSLP